MAGTPGGIAESIANNDPVGDVIPRSEGNEARYDDGSQSKEEPKGLTKEDIEATIREQLGPLNDKISELSQENAFLRGSFQNSQQQIQPPAERQVEKPKRWSESVSDEDKVKGLREQPLATLQNMINDALTPIIEQINGVSQRFDQDRARSQFDQQLASDAARLNEDYGHLKENKEWTDAANAEYNRMTNGDGRNYRPGMLSDAAARTTARFLREGKLQRPGSDAVSFPNGNGHTVNGPASVARAFRNGNTHGAENSSGARGAEGSGNSGEPRTIDDLISRGFLTQTDKRAALKIAAKYGVSEAEYVANYMADKKSNPRFGER